MTLTLPIEILLIVSGLIVGFINTLSAGGTAISISIYLALGLPVDVVNATNRVGVLIQSISSSITYHSKKVLDYKKALLLAIPTTIGAFIGAGVQYFIPNSKWSLQCGLQYGCKFYNGLLKTDEVHLSNDINDWQSATALYKYFIGQKIFVQLQFNYNF